MSSLCNFMDHPEWTPEQRTAVALVETLRMKRSEEEQARAERNHARATSMLAVPGKSPLPPCADPGTASTSLPAAEESALTPLGEDDTAAGNPPPPSMASTLAWAVAAIAGWALFGWGVIALIEAVRSAS